MDYLTTNATSIITGLIVLAALVLLYVVSRGLGARIKGRRGQRLGISEYHELDKTRRLVLIRRDNTEHLVLIGGNQDLVIESGIGVREPMVSDEEIDEEPAQRQPMRPAPRPAVFGDRALPLRAVPRDDPRFKIES
jgi:Flagellar biosynthesis protein, FliO